ncbi:MAG: GNAT family N-acetyltransferase [Solirubrobacteraceae bacterium]
MTDAATVRPLTDADFDAWAPLWAGYLRFYRTVLPDEVTQASFARLVAREDGVAGLVAEVEGRVAGFAHVIEHRTSWTLGTSLYLEDLFVDPDIRGGGVGRALIAAVYAEADARGCERTYWITEEFNWVARRTYETVAHRKSYITYER